MHALPISPFDRGYTNRRRKRSFREMQYGVECKLPREAKNSLEYMTRKIRDLSGESHYP